MIGHISMWIWPLGVRSLCLFVRGTLLENWLSMATAISVVVLLCLISVNTGYRINSYTNDESRPGAHLIIISAPSRRDPYYSKSYNDIIMFDIEYAKKIMGKDNVVVLGDGAAMKIFKRHLPNDILLRKRMKDIWMRDFTTINPYNPVQFRFTAASYNNNLKKANRVQSSFTTYFKSLGVVFDETPKWRNYFMDGGNVVDNYKDKIVVTNRFLEDNHLTKAEAKVMLKRFYQGVDKVAIVPSDDPDGLSHSDGMVMFINNNAALITNYNYDLALKNRILSELQAEFPGIDLIEDADTWDPTNPYDPNISSACGLMVNGVLTEKFLYVPTFNNPTDNSIINAIQAKTDRTVVPVSASSVCKMGGSVRCLSWQQTGENAKKIIQAARK